MGLHNCYPFSRSGSFVKYLFLKSDSLKTAALWTVHTLYKDVALHGVLAEVTLNCILPA